MKNLRLTNTISKDKEFFKPLKNKKVKLYVCGITPYDSAHLGHGRCYVVFDVLFRVLKFIGYDVTYVRNFTDIDDKLINKAKKESDDVNKYKEIAERYIKEFEEDVTALGCLIPTHEPRVTDNIPEIISFIKELIEKNKAYVVDGDVYFDTTSFSNYGKLSGKNLDDLIAGIRVEVNEKKKHPGDFALWKGNEEGLFWKSPWGHGRPGWHIECSVLANKFLGSSIDIHGGGMDLIFPHHENELAQSEALTGKPFVSYWIHNALLNLDKVKMSKSLGNFFTLREVFKKYDPMVLRYYYLQHHYRTPIDFSIDGLESVQKAYKKLINVFSKIPLVDQTEIQNDIVDRMLDALCDDLNTSRVLGILFENLNRIQESKDLASEVKSFLVSTMGLSFKPIEEAIKITPEIQKLMDEREDARKNRDWAKADAIRDKLSEMGVELHDKHLD
ncbi:cysteine--tRNA ligase [Candidatus Babeliales bacterium]|nr:cysteine--tRNA ligase [Candidatus Babeliales bacterium]